MGAVVKWVDAREMLPRSGMPVAVAVMSWPDLWLVLPMHFTTPVTHWAYLPPLPGLTVHHVEGEGARTALRNAWG